jgi:hypothetical protein
MILQKLFDRAAFLSALILALGAPSNILLAYGGGGTGYVDAVNGDDATGDGSEANPWKSITHSLTQIPDVLVVRPGLYDDENGEDFPLTLPTHGDFTLQGPGDATAILQARDHFDENETVKLDYGWTGTKTIDGLRIEMLSKFGGPSMNDYPINAGSAGGVLHITNNELVGGRAGIRSAISADGAERHIENNHISSGRNGMFLYHSDDQTNVQTVVRGNTISGVQEDGIYLTAYVSDDSTTVSGTYLIENNSISGAGEEGIEMDFSVYHSTNELLDYDVTIKGNTITDAGIEGILFYLSSWSDDSNTAIIDLVIDGNTITGTTEDAIDIGVDMYSDGMILQLDVDITNNTISGGGEDGIDASFEAYSTSNSANIDFKVLNNTITGNDQAGVDISASVSETAQMNAVFVVNNNLLQNNESGIELDRAYGKDETTTFNFTLAGNGNSILGNSEVGVGLALLGKGSAAGAYTYDLRFQNNTIVGNGVVTNLGSNTTYFDFRLRDVPAEVIPTVHASENFWGSQDSASIAGRVYDGLDNPGEAIVDHSSPRPEDLSFTVMGLGDSMVITAEADATAFVHQAGNLNDGTGAALAVTVDGSAVPDSDIVVTTGTITISPVPGGLTGTADVCVTNPGGQSGCAEYNSGPNTAAPQAIYDAAETTGVIPVTIDVVANDTDVDGNLDSTSVAITQGPQQGSVVNHGDGTVTYTPNPGPLTTDTFNYTVSDTGGLVSNIATVEVRTTDGGSGGGGDNTAPNALYDGVETPNGTAITIDVVANDTDADGNLDPTTVTITQVPGQGTAVNNGDGTVTYTPNEGPNTSDTFNYTVADTGGLVSNHATVSIQTTGGGSGGGGENSAPAAIYDAATTAPETAVTIDVAANDTDADGNLDATTVTITQAPHKGTASVNADGTVVYTPSAGTSATTDTFNYTVDDTDGATSNTATVEVTISPDGDDSNLGGSGPPLRRDLGPPTTVPGS